MGIIKHSAFRLSIKVQKKYTKREEFAKKFSTNAYTQAEIDFSFHLELLAVIALTVAGKRGMSKMIERHEEIYYHYFDIWHSIIAKAEFFLFHFFVTLSSSHSAYFLNTFSTISSFTYTRLLCTHEKLLSK
jgi:hypothetical protein